MIINNFSSRQFSAYKNQQYSKIYQHELAHKNAAGALGGPIAIEKDPNGVAIAGHVDIKMPQLNETNPEATIKDAQTVISAALAPSDPSDQDKKVAAEAQGILEKAKNQQAQNGQAQIEAPQSESSGNCTDSSCGNKLNFWA